MSKEKHEWPRLGPGNFRGRSPYRRDERDSQTRWYEQRWHEQQQQQQHRSSQQMYTGSEWDEEQQDRQSLRRNESFNGHGHRYQEQFDHRSADRDWSSQRNSQPVYVRSQQDDYNEQSFGGRSDAQRRDWEVHIEYRPVTSRHEYNFHEERSFNGRSNATSRLDSHSRHTSATTHYNTGTPSIIDEPRQRHALKRSFEDVNQETQHNFSEQRMKLTTRQSQCRKLGYRALQNLVHCEPSKLLSTLTTEKNGFPDALKDDSLLSKPDCMAAMLAVIAKALKCQTSPASTSHLLNIIQSSPFMGTYLSKYFTEMTKKIGGFRQPLKDSLLLYQQIFKFFPENVNVNVKISFGTLDYTLTRLTDSLAIDDELQASLVETRQLMQGIISKQKCELQTADTQQQEPLDFRELSIFPDIRCDIQCAANPVLMKNIVHGAFNSTDHYLEVQFRLLREDFIRPLRNGIREFLANKDGTASKRRKLTDVYMYHDVHIMNPICTSDGINYRVKFDSSGAARVQWQCGKRLKYGSLLCLSSDDFQTMHVAVVSQSDPKSLEDGELIIKFENEAHPNTNILSEERFLMVESSAYFEACRYVLTALQQSTEKDIPFVNNIVFCQSKIEPPIYLRSPGKQFYNLRALSPFNQNSGNKLDITENDQLVNQLEYVQVMRHDSFTSLEALGLDSSQLRALQTALTKQIAIIQGPPGTGKTYIGLKIVQALLGNAYAWSTGAVNSPVLVVCYTNHALDQFLEGLCQFIKSGIVRVGGRSKSKRLDNCMLTKHRQDIRNRREVEKNIFANRIDAQKDLERWQNEIEKNTALLEGTERGIIHEDVLHKTHKYMLEEHYEDLTHDFSSHQHFSTVNVLSAFNEWLDIRMIRELLGKKSHAFKSKQNNKVERESERKVAEANYSSDEDDDKTLQRTTYDYGDDSQMTQRQFQMEQRQKRNQELADATLVSELDFHSNSMPICNPMASIVNSNDTMSKEESDEVRNIWRLSHKDRWRLYCMWLKEYRKGLQQKIHEATSNFQIAVNRMKEILEQEDMAIMRSMKIIGMTTSGAARYKATLRIIQPKIVIVEEAAEVLEAHVITTLSGQCQHLILIGDHKQLRPSPNVYDLAENYNLKYSLFERLVMNGFEHNALDRQHRMRPEIADFMRIIYNGLVDDESDCRYENIKGVASNVFFINHNEEESSDNELNSVHNEHEANFIISFSRYLLQQGYSADQLTILAPYTGQTQRLKQLSRSCKNVKEVRICTIDNYQGEENDIVLLSMVRSNVCGKVGFMKEDNRTCVALSRARMGLYVIGNFELLASQSSLWQSVLSKARSMGVEGPALKLCCRNHPEDKSVMVKTSEDFRLAPEGGCKKKCTYRLKNCGHACDSICHTYDNDHTEYQCQKPCQKLCPQGHECKKKCYEYCGPCMKPIKTTIPACKHEQDVPCSVPIGVFRCKETCKFILPCGHPCCNKCGEDHTRYCNHNVVKTCSKGHQTTIKCQERIKNIPCKEPCITNLSDCNHQCTGNCGQCLAGRIHAACTSNCGRTLVCGHQCDEPCTKKCPPCKRKCENRCNHSNCPNQCGQPCVPCNERCLWQCDHFKCTRLCHEPCDRDRCNEPCKKKLRCGHDCIGLCGETCPSKCRICDQEEVTEIFLGREDEPDARYVQLEDCKHIFEVSDLDHWMQTEVDENEKTTIQLKTCPRCKVPIRRNLRYGQVINEVLTDIEAVKNKIIGNPLQNTRHANRLYFKLSDFESSCSFLKLFYQKKLRDGMHGSLQGISHEELIGIENVITFVETVNKLKREVKMKMLMSATHNLSNEIPTCSLQTINDGLKILKEWLLVERHRVSDQQVKECRLEVARLALLFDFYKMAEQLNVGKYPLLSAETKAKFPDVFKQLASVTALDLEMENVARKMLKDINQEEQARIEIVKAVGETQGHWFKCPNGHPYAIGDCGGAMERGQCPDCKATVGGEQHRLLDNNHFAPEMDNAATPAWPGTNIH